MSLDFQKNKDMMFELESKRYLKPLLETMNRRGVTKMKLTASQATDDSRWDVIIVVSRAIAGETVTKDEVYKLTDIVTE